MHGTLVIMNGTSAGSSLTSLCAAGGTKGAIGENASTLLCMLLGNTFSEGTELGVIAKCA
jgi:hypothetical protein